MVQIYNVDVDCPNCAERAKIAVNNVKGVKSCTIDFFKQKMIIDYDSDVNMKEKIVQIEKVCKVINHNIEIY